MNNSGVEKNLQDHTFMIIIHQMSDEKYSLNALLASSEFVHNAMTEYTKYQTGFFASMINIFTYISYKQIHQHAEPMTTILKEIFTSS